MKRIAIISIILNIILLIVLMYMCSFKSEDVNKDREVNALDLGIVQKYILEESDKNGKNTI